MKTTKDFTYNYVDRVRLAENSLHIHKCPIRGSGWRHNQSVSHLDLATSCPITAYGLNHWSSNAHHQLRHSRSLDYSHHLDCYKDSTDITEYYWHIDPDYDGYTAADESEEQKSILGYKHNDHQQQQQQQHYRDYCGNYADKNYHSTNSIYPPEQAQQSSPIQQSNALYDFGSEACSLRRSRSLAVIREETFSDLQITSTNSNRRRSQLIPRARLVNRGLYRERERLLCGNNNNNSNNKHHQSPQQQNTSREKLTSISTEQDPTRISCGTGSVCDSHHNRQPQLQHQQQQQKQQQQQQQHRHHHHHHQQLHLQSREADDYYDNLKRLDALTADLAEHLHPWHNDKSDLESLNSDYFKNSLHQSHDISQQHLDIETLEQAVNLLTREKPPQRIYQSRRRSSDQQNLAATSQVPQQQQRLHQSSIANVASCGDSCPENSQSSIFPETTTSNSDDQTDSISLSEQEYDLKRIEEIFHNTGLDGDEENYELISLTTTTRTRIETTEDEEDEQVGETADRNSEFHQHITTGPENETESTLKHPEDVCQNLEKLIAYDSVYLSSEEGSDGTLIEENCESYETTTVTATVADENLLHISIEDTVIEKQAKHSKSSSEKAASTQTQDYSEDQEIIEIETKINIADQIHKEKVATNLVSNEPVLYTQILDVEHTPIIAIPTTTVGVTSSVASKPKILSVVEKRKWKRSTAESTSTLLPNVNDSLQPRTIEEHHHNPSNKENHLVQLNRKEFDSYQIPLRAHPGDNQYHSLPDIHIGQSLNVSECIDAKLRSSYHLNKYQRSAHGDTIDCKSSEEATTRKKLKHNDEHIYDSIEKFRHTHQKATPKEYHQQQTAKQEEVKEPSDSIETHTKIDANKPDLVEKIANESSEEVKHKVNAVDVVNSDASSKDANLYSSAQHIGNVNIALDTSSPNDANEFVETPKEEPTVEVENFSRQIERRAKEIKEIREKQHEQKPLRHSNQIEQFERTTVTTATFRVNKSTNKFLTASHRTHANNINQFRIIVNDAQNNAVAKDCLERSREDTDAKVPDETQIELAHVPENIKDLFKDKSTATNSRVLTLKRVPSKSKRPHQHHHHQRSLQQLNKVDTTDNHNNENEDNNHTKSKERRVLGAQIYRARPIKILTTNDSFRRSDSRTANKMSRPQILHVVDNKRKSDISNIISNASNNSNNNASTRLDTRTKGSQAENEYFKKIDSVRNYWSKLAQDEMEHEQQIQNCNEQIAKKESNQQQQQQQQFILGLTTEEARANEASNTCQDQDICYSYMPSIEIVELDGEKKATIVSAASPNDTFTNDASEPLFDHIRYKVLKSQQLIRSNILAAHNKKKEAQFDGLIQYLQDYSFQELLSNNNVVIVEPVRTKVECPHGTNTLRLTNAATKSQQDSNTTSNDAHTANTTIATTNLSKHRGSTGGGGIRRHFFYQPVRVNRELYEEELPNPDMVRNVRKFFEEHILPTPGRGVLVREKSNGQQMQQPQNTNSTQPTSPKSRRARKYRYLTIDTSYGNTVHGGQPSEIQQHKWDTASFSSGISSGDLSPPHECNDGINMTKLNEVAATTDGSPAAVQELKGVHVLDVVRRHNSKSHLRNIIDINALKVSSSSSYNDTPKSECGSTLSHSAIYESSGDSAYYRNIYDYNLVRDYSPNDEEDNEAHDEDVYEEIYDDDDELSESYYVSNDILEKIRECGSSVTYYGGRVLKSTSPEPFHNHISSSNINNNNNNGNSNNVHGVNTVPTINQEPIHSVTTMTSNISNTTMTLTRARVQAIEKCNNSQSIEEVPHIRQLNEEKQCDRYCDTNVQNCSNRTIDDPGAEHKMCQQLEEDNGESSYTGIKFKLVKSNSCNSRLELAGAIDVVTTTSDNADELDGFEVVRRMVHHFESNTKNTQLTQPHPTVPVHQQISSEIEQNNCNNINNINDSAMNCITVNNQIYVPVAGGSAIEMETSKSANNCDATTTSEQRAKVCDNKTETDVIGTTDMQSTLKTYHSTSMDIHLDTSGREKVKNNINNGNLISSASTGITTTATKICRNKNVDLAFALAKQQQQQSHKSTGTAIKDNVGVSQQQQQQHQQTNDDNEILKIATITKTMYKKHIPTMSKTLETAGCGAGGSHHQTDVHHDKKAAADNVEKMNTITQLQKSTANMPDVETTTTMLNRTQNVAPVEIPTRITEAIALRKHQTEEKSTSDRNFVRHYVANDKSLFVKRKYDDIEFEEFEVYDPRKDLQKLIEDANNNENNEQHTTQSGITGQGGKRTENALSTVDTNKPEQFETKGNNYNEHHEQMYAKDIKTGKLKSTSSNHINVGHDFATLNDDEMMMLAAAGVMLGVNDENVETRKLKLENLCYECVDVKL